LVSKHYPAMSIIISPDNRFILSGTGEGKIIIAGDP